MARIGSSRVAKGCERCRSAAAARSQAASTHPLRPADRAQRALGNRGTARLLLRQAGVPRTGATADPHEREAESVADRLMRMSSPVPAAKCAECAGSGAPCPGCQGSHAVQTRSPAPVNPSRPGPGRPLDAGSRAFFEPRFGHDLSQVRVHADPRAAHAAQALGARAFTLGRDIHFGAGEYAPATMAGRSLLAHELVHVVQQSGGDRARARPSIHGAPQKVQRRVIDRHVSCRNTGLHGGVPGGTISGPDAIAIIRAADARAINLAQRAENLLFLQRLTFGTGGHVPDADFDAALANRFGLTLADPADRRIVAILEREFTAVVDFLESGSIFYVCRDAGCDDPDTWAFVFSGERTIRLCNPFWNSGNVDQQGATLLHEALHLWWDQVNDAGAPLHNAHCFEQFALDLAGVAVNPDFVGACVV